MRTDVVKLYIIIFLKINDTNIAGYEERSKTVLCPSEGMVTN